MPAENTESSSSQSSSVSSSMDASAGSVSQPNPSGNAGAQSSSQSTSSGQSIQDVENQHREILNGLLGVTGDGKSAKQPAEGKRAGKPESGEPTPGDDNAQGSADQQGQGQDAQRAQREAPEYKKAAQALSRAKWPKAVINSLSPEDVIAHGTAIAAEQARIDRMGNELAQYKQRAPQTSPVGQNAGAQKPAAQQADGQGGQGQPAEPAQAQAAQQQSASQDGGEKPWNPLIAKLRDDPVLSDLAPQFEQVFDALTSSHTQEVQSLRQQIQQMEQRSQQQLEQQFYEQDQAGFSQAREALKPEYEVLADDENYQAVVDRAYVLAESYPEKYVTGGKPDWQKLVKDATRLEFGEAIEKQLKTQTRTEFNRQANGQPTPHRASSRSPKSMTPDEQSMLAAELLAKGKSPDEVRATLAAR